MVVANSKGAPGEVVVVVYKWPKLPRPNSTLLQYVLFMSCFGVLWSVLRGRNVTVCGETYRVVRRIGEGGT